MSNTTILQANIKEKIQPVSLNWVGNPSVQKLLDVVVSIIVEEYIQIAKQNPDVFSNSGLIHQAPTNKEDGK